MTAIQPGQNYSAEAAADFTGKRYTVVKLDNDGKVVQATAATDAILGVIDNEPKAGRTADVVLVNGSGSFKVKTGANITKDALITTNGAGLAISTTTTGNRVIRPSSKYNDIWRGGRVLQI
nr:hypothetical protein [Rhodococcus qingshengii]